VSLSQIKILKYLILNDKDRFLTKWFIKKPFSNTIKFFISFFKKNTPYINIKPLEFQELLKNPKTSLYLGFSYCQKPQKCPSLFFSANCICEKNNSICQNCSIGKYQSLNNVNIFIITTIHSLAKKLFELTDQNPSNSILFVITACPFAIALFQNFSSLLPIKGVSLPLDGKVCTTFKGFSMAEKGKKNGPTVLSISQEEFLNQILSLKNSR
jgi:hypothetical protein